MPRASGRRTAAGRLIRAESPARIRLWQLALAALAGNLAVHQLPALPDAALVAAAMLGVGIAVLIVRGRWVLLSAAGICAVAWTTERARDALESRWPQSNDGQDVALTGWIDGIPRQDPGRTLITVRVTGHDVPLRRVRLSWYEPPFELAAGQSLEIEARLRAPRGLSNPGGFDYERWLLLEGFDATGYVRSGRVDQGAIAGIAQRWLRFRTRLAASLEREIADPNAAALIQALSLGERSGFGDRHWTVLQRTGTSHLVAVSGLHIGLIAGGAYVAVLWFLLRSPYRCARHAHALAAGICIFPAVAYAALAGFALPTRRALLMLMVAQVLILLRRRWPWSGGLGLALIVVLVVDPLASLSASFWLSFTAVALILTAARRRRPTTYRAARFGAACVQFTRLQWALTVGLTPLVVMFFGQASLASLAVNLIAIPLFVFLIVPVTLFSTLVLAVTGDGFWILALAEKLALLAWLGLEQASRFEFAAVPLPPPSLSVLLLSLAAVALALPDHCLPGRRLALVGLLPLVFGRVDRTAYGEARVTVLDVGHGLAVAVDSGTHRALYDAGPVYQSGFDSGAEIVLPAIAALGPGPVDLLILSHGDNDHAGGAAAIRSRYPNADLLVGPDIDEPRAMHCRAGQEWSRNGVDFSVLHPPRNWRFRGNESSCVLRIDTAYGSMLLTGDIEARAEAVLAENDRLAVDVVVVPHHGSLTSSSVRFVEQADADVAVVSAGHNNRWGFPRPEVRARWESRGTAVMVTGELGAIDLHFAAGGLKIEASREKRRRYWHTD